MVFLAGLFSEIKSTINIPVGCADNRYRFTSVVPNLGINDSSSFELIRAETLDLLKRIVPFFHVDEVQL